MKIRNKLMTILVFFAAMIALHVSAAEHEVEAVVRGNNAFGVDVYNKLREKPGNLFFSPHSISTALAMTYGGARGDTETEMAKALRFSLEQDALHRAFASLQEGLTVKGEKPPYQLNIANRLWGQTGYKFSDEFITLTRDSYGAALEQLNFVERPDQSRLTINRWVEDQTNRKIQDLLPSGSITTDTRLVLTNAIYFLGNWTSPFRKDRTRNGPFHLSADKKVEVPMMNQKGYFRSQTFDGMQVLELPYQGRKLAMMILLPKKVDKLPELEKLLSAEKIDEWHKSMKYGQVTVYMPRFKTTSQFTLNEPLQSLGMKRAFDPNTADLSGMNGRRDLYVSSVVHKAFVDVNELGTEAAAATGVVVGVTSLGPEPVVFKAEHPFIYLIRDNKTGSILFLGRLTNPKA